MTKLRNIKIIDRKGREDLPAQPVEDVERFVVRAIYEVHRVLSTGMPHRACQMCLAKELRDQGFSVETDAPFPIEYKGGRISGAMSIDLLVEDCIIVMVGGTETAVTKPKIFLANHLKASEKPVGFFVDFSVSDIRQGIIKLAKRQDAVDVPEDRTIN